MHYLKYEQNVLLKIRQPKMTFRFQKSLLSSYSLLGDFFRVRSGKASITQLSYLFENELGVH